MPPWAIVRVTIQPIYSTGHGAATNTFPGFSTVSLGSLERWPCEERQCTREITQRRLTQKFSALPKWYYRSCPNPHRRKELVHRRPPSVQFSSVTQSCPTLCNPMNSSTPGLPVHHQLLEFTQTHVHRAGDAIQLSHLLSWPSPPNPNPSQHQGLF